MCLRVVEDVDLYVCMYGANILRAVWWMTTSAIPQEEHFSASQSLMHVAVCPSSAPSSTGAQPLCSALSAMPVISRLSAARGFSRAEYPAAKHGGPRVLPGGVRAGTSPSTASCAPPPRAHLPLNVQCTWQLAGRPTTSARRGHKDLAAIIYIDTYTLLL